MSTSGMLDLPFSVIAAGISLSVLGWMFFRLESVWSKNGPLDL
jgi:hypothetical protein